MTQCHRLEMWPTSDPPDRDQHPSIMGHDTVPQTGDVGLHWTHPILSLFLTHASQASNSPPLFPLDKVS